MRHTFLLSNGTSFEVSKSEDGTSLRIRLRPTDLPHKDQVLVRPVNGNVVELTAEECRDE